MTETLDQVVATEIRAEMARQRKLQSELATHLNKTQATVSRYMAGTQPIRLDELERIAAFLNVDVARFLARVA